MLNRRKNILSVAIGGVCLLTMLGMSGCGRKKEDIISSELVNDEKGFGTDKAEYGDLVKIKKYNAQLVYPVSTVMKASYNNLTYSKACVETNQSVKKGDLLIEMQPISSEMLAKREEEISKNKEEFESGKNNLKNQMQAVEQQMGSSSGTDLQILELKKKKLQCQYDWYVQDGEKVQKEMKEELERLKSVPEDGNIYAPYDGVIDSVSAVKEGTELTTERELLTMHSNEQILLSVSDAAGLRYRMQVDIQIGTGDNIKNYTGTVLTANNVRTDEFKNGTAYICLNEKVDESELKNIIVIAKEIELHNVLTVKQFAVTEQKGNSYVSIIDGDRIMKRPVVVGGSTDDEAWILKGLEEGQTVSIQ